MERAFEGFNMRISRMINENGNLSSLNRNRDVTLFLNREEFESFIFMHIRAMDRDHAKLFTDHETSETEQILKNVKECCNRYSYIAIAVAGLSREVLVSVVQTVFDRLRNDGMGGK